MIQMELIKKYVDDNIDQSTILRLNDDSHERYLQMRRVGNTTYNLQICNQNTNN